MHVYPPHRLASRVLDSIVCPSDICRCLVAHAPAFNVSLLDSLMIAENGMDPVWTNLPRGLDSRALIPLSLCKIERKRSFGNTQA